MNTVDIVTSFDQLIQQLNLFKQSLYSQAPRHWVPLTDSEKNAGIPSIEKAADLYLDIWYVGEQDGRETRSCPGLVGCTPELINLAQEINKLKDQFKLAVQRVQGKRDTWHQLKSELNKRHQQVRESLHFQGLARLHLKQVYRHIPILDSKPIKAGFSWYTGGRSIKKISVDEARALLEKLDSQGPHVALQLENLNKLSPQTTLARVQNQAPVMRVNLLFDESSPKSRKAMNVSLPVLFPLANEEPFPSHNTPKLEPPTDRDRLQRSDLKIEKQAFLPSIRVHRYIK